MGKKKTARYESGGAARRCVQGQSRPQTRRFDRRLHERQGLRGPLGAIAVGYREKGKPAVYASHVGSGFDDPHHENQRRKPPEPLARDSCPFS